ALVGGMGLSGISWATDEEHPDCVDCQAARAANQSYQERIEDLKRTIAELESRQVDRCESGHELSEDQEEGDTRFSEDAYGRRHRWIRVTSSKVTDRLGESWKDEDGVIWGDFGKDEDGSP